MPGRFLFNSPSIAAVMAVAIAAATAFSAGAQTAVSEPTPASKPKPSGPRQVTAAQPWNATRDAKATASMPTSPGSSWDVKLKAAKDKACSKTGGAGDAPPSVVVRKNGCPK